MARAKKRTTTRKKATTKKTTARKTAARKTPAKRAAARKPAKRKVAKKAAPRKAPKLKVGKTPLKKTEVFNYIADKVELSKKEVAGVFEALGEVMQGHLKKNGPGEFTVPGLMKCKVQRKPATKARKGINPFTGEEMVFKAKPARNVVKVRPLKKLKEMAG